MVTQDSFRINKELREKIQFDYMLITKRNITEEIEV